MLTSAPCECVALRFRGALAAAAPTQSVLASIVCYTPPGKSERLGRGLPATNIADLKHEQHHGGCRQPHLQAILRALQKIQIALTLERIAAALGCAERALPCCQLGAGGELGCERQRPSVFSYQIPRRPLPTRLPCSCAILFLELVSASSVRFWSPQFSSCSRQSSSRFG